jgi:hypothetical protein
MNRGIAAKLRTAGIVGNGELWAAGGLRTPHRLVRGDSAERERALAVRGGGSVRSGLPPPLALRTGVWAATVS